MTKTTADAVALARAIDSLPYLCTQEQMMTMCRALLELAEENARLRKVVEATDLTVSRAKHLLAWVRKATDPDEPRYCANDIDDHIGEALDAITVLTP